MNTQITMPVVIVPVTTEQWLSDVSLIYPLPTNGIYHKRLPGLGATFGEILAPRHSIIILPNRPVIENKVAKHNHENTPEHQIFGVYKGITKAKILEYLSNETVTYKKVLITPESYDLKFRGATSDILDYIKKEYYMLIDECERAIQDVDFRSKISAPFDDFFSFTNKGLISATTLPFSDPQFDENDFTHYVIQPNYKYNKPLSLICTNNIVKAFKDYLANHPSEQYFIFCSSIMAMTSIITAMGIKEASKIYCSEGKVTALKMQHFKASSMLDAKKLTKYNFLTSRYYSALDIELDDKPDVLMLTEVVFAEHSILDPQTEVIQIVGRFRNGTKSITHITNFNSEIKTKTVEEARNYMDGQREVYNQILKLKQTMTSEGAQEAIRQILTEPKFARYFKNDGSYNWFMMDNYIQEERVLGLYQSVAKLTEAYALVSDHFDLTVTDQFYELTDNDRLKRQSAISRKDEIKEVVSQLKRIQMGPEKYVIGSEDFRNELRLLYPDVVKGFETIGEQGIVEAGYLESRIRQAVIKSVKEQKIYSPAVIAAVRSKFAIGNQYYEMFISTTLQDIYDRHDIKERAFASHIKRYFEAVRSSARGSNDKVYNLIGELDQARLRHD